MSSVFILDKFSLGKPIFVSEERQEGRKTCEISDGSTIAKNAFQPADFCGRFCFSTRTVAEGGEVLTLLLTFDGEKVRERRVVRQEECYE